MAMYFDLGINHLDLQLVMSSFRSIGNRKSSRAQEQTLLMTCADNVDGLSREACQIRAVSALKCTYDSWPARVRAKSYCTATCKIRL